MQGNLNWMQSRETSLKSPVWCGRENEIRPYGNPKASDSANLDSAAEVWAMTWNIYRIGAFKVFYHFFLVLCSVVNKKWSRR